MDRNQIRFYRRILEVDEKIINVINCIPYSHSFIDQIILSYALNKDFISKNKLFR